MRSPSPRTPLPTFFKRAFLRHQALEVLALLGDPVALVELCGVDVALDAPVCAEEEDAGAGEIDGAGPV